MRTDGRGRDERRDPRVPLVLRVEYPASFEAFRDATENLSAGGLFIRTDAALAQGQRVPLQISFPGLLEPFEIEVEVLRHRIPSPEEPGGVAVRIPGDRPGDRERLASLAEAARAGPPAPRRSYRVLVVEDNRFAVDMYRHALRRMRSPAPPLDVAVEYASDGRDALGRLSHTPPLDLVISDVFMPGMDGFGLVERIRADPGLRALPVMLVSAGGPEARERGLHLGADAYLQKPVRFAEIIETVRTLLELE